MKGLIPEEARLIETHEYVLVFDEEDRARVGISHYAAEALGDVVYVELPEIGQTLAKGDSLGSIESVKAASDLYMPVSGEVVAVNSQLEDEPNLVNDDCYGDGWMLEIKLDRAEEIQALMTPEQYMKFLEESQA
ncbi:MAG: glycine cleavage system protein GcvH [Vampirovibrionales bacterium]|nr:glycine cleavage system protein GcvH [Vampirovibrionales bacterium]